jgi:Helix-turn-helix
LGRLAARGGPVERQVARSYLKRRGEMTYAEFCGELGISPSTLHRLENGDQSITLRGRTSTHREAIKV